MIKPQMLKKGDKAAIVSLSSGMAGEEAFRRRYETGKRRLEAVFGLEVVEMPNTLKGEEFCCLHPEKRAADLMAAFYDPSIKAVISCIGGDDTIRLLPHIDFGVIRDNPKVFIGYSDTTVNHFMMYKAGLVSFYGPAVLSEFAENVRMHEYTLQHIQKTLFEKNDTIDIMPSPKWTSQHLDWSDGKNSQIERTMTVETRGYEVLQGCGTAEGRLLGGCVDVFPMISGTSIWPEPERWKGVILFLETSEDYPSPEAVKYTLRNMAAQGIMNNINGILVGKPRDEKYYEEYKQMYKEFFCIEAKRPELPIIYNMNFGHTSPMCTLPYGIMARIDCDNKRVTLLESPVKSF